MKSVIIYTRVSTEDQAREGVSLIAQREACAMLCKLRGYADHDAVEDAAQSAKNLNRPGIARILKGVEAGEVKTLVVWRLDRLTRDLLDMVATFDLHKVALVSVMEQLDTSSPMGRLILKNAVENHFTAKQQRAQRTYIKNKTHLFGEVLDHTKLNSKPCLSFVSLRLCVGNLNSYCRV
jgi:DNA invertase Pin-like site-specific DNA recombinase